MSPGRSAIPCAIETASSPDTALALDLPHAAVEHAVQHHPAKGDLQLARVEVGCPGAYGLVVVVEYTDEAGTQELDIARTRVYRWFVHFTRR
jgi:hypothetical protein